MKFLNIFRRKKSDDRYQGRGPGDYAPLAFRLKELLIAANKWGKKNKYPIYDDYPQYKEIQEIGKKLHNMGGLKLMRKVYYTVEGHIPYPGMSTFWWDRIGNWQA